MTSNIINKEIDVVHLRSESDLILETNTQIKLSTSNILINYVPFDEYISKVVFDTDITSSGLSNAIHNTWASNVAGDNTKIDLTTNTSVLIVDEVHTSGIFSTHSHINNTVHFINLSAANNVQLSNLSNSSNIIYNHQGTSYSLSNYIYNVINNTPASYTPVTLSPDTAPSSGTRTGIDTLGTYIGNKILTNKLTTTDVTVGGSEPVLELNSATAINFMTDVYGTEGDVNTGSNILFGNLSLDSLVKSQLDETGLLDLGVTLSSGQNIGISLDSFTNNGAGTVKDVFTYSVLFQLYTDSNPSIPLDLESLIPHPFQITKQITFPFTQDSFILGDATDAILSLDAGQFYTVVATFTNLRTNTVVENVILEPRSVATIEFITGLYVTIVDETKFNITFTGHATQVPGITVTFKVKIGWGSTTLIPYHNSSQTQNLNSEVSKSIGFNLLTNDLNSSTNYGSRYVKNNTEHIFEIQSESSSFAIMNTPSFTLPAFTFSAPSYAPILSINYGSNQLTWTHTNNTADKLSIITFELFQGLTSKQDNTNTYYDITSLSIGTWKVWAKNVYGLSSGYSNEQKIVNPRFNIGSISANGNRKFNIGISSVNANGTHTLSGSYLTSTQSSSSITTNTLIPGTYTFTVTLTDQLNLSTNRTTSSTLSINDPSINSFGSFVNSGTLQFYVTVSVSNPNVSWSITSGNYSSVSGSNIYYTFPASDTGGAKSVSVTITDSYGYTASRTNNVNLSVSFAGGSTPSTSVSVSGTTISFTSGLTSYKWYLNNSLISNTNSNPHEFIMSASHFGSIHCVAIETNGQGFTRTITSATTTNTQPTLSSKSFTGFNMSNDPPTPIYTYTLGPYTYINDTIENSISMNPTAFNGVNTYILNGNFKNQHGLNILIEIGRHIAENPIVTIRDLTINTLLNVHFVSTTNNETYTGINIYIDNLNIYNTFSQSGNNFTLYKYWVKWKKPNFYENGVTSVIKVEYVYKYYSNIYNTINCVIHYPNDISYTINVDNTNSISIDNVSITGNNHDIFTIENIYYIFGNSSSFMSQSTSNSITSSTLMSNSLLSATQHIEVIVNYKLNFDSIVYSLTKNDQASWNINTNNIVLHEFAIVDGAKYDGLKYQLIGVEIEPTSTIFGIQLSNCTFSSYRFKNIQLVSATSISLYEIYYDVFGYDGNSSKLNEKRWLYATPAFTGNMYDSYYYSNLSIEVFYNGDHLATLSSANKRSCIYENDRGGRRPDKWVLLNMQIPASMNDWDTWWDFKMDNGNTWYNTPATWMLN